MSSGNGVIRIGKKGIKEFAFGEEGQPGSEPFKVDVVEVFHEWLAVDEEFRSRYDEDVNGNRPIPNCDLKDFNTLKMKFLDSLRGIDTNSPDYKPTLSKAEVIEFYTKLRDSYDELVSFFQPKSLQKQDLQNTSEPQSQVVFSEEVPTES